MGLISGAAGIVGGPVAGFFVEHWRGILLTISLVVIIGSAYYYVWDLHHQIAKLTEQNVTLKDSLNLCNQAKADLEMAVKNQNDSIERLKKAGETAAAKAAVATKEAVEIGKTYAGAIDRMSKQPKPVDCTGAVLYLKDRTDLKWDKK